MRRIYTRLINLRLVSRSDKWTRSTAIACHCVPCRVACHVVADSSISVSQSRTRTWQVSADRRLEKMKSTTCGALRPERVDARGFAGMFCATEMRWPAVHVRLVMISRDAADVNMAMVIMMTDEMVTWDEGRHAKETRSWPHFSNHAKRAVHHASM